MLLRFLILGISFVATIFIFDILLPTINEKYKLHKELKESKQRKKAFRKTMKELEII